MEVLVNKKVAVPYPPSHKSYEFSRLNSQSEESLFALTDYSEMAKKEMKERELRAVVVRSKLTEDPIWDILLDLYWHWSRGKLISVTSVCIASKCPNTTALRMIGILEEEGLIQRLSDMNDKRRRFITLTTMAVEKMQEYFRRKTGNSGDFYVFSS